jgi:hypothetical protein
MQRMCLLRFKTYPIGNVLGSIWTIYVVPPPNSGSVQANSKLVGLPWNIPFQHLSVILIFLLLIHDHPGFFLVSWGGVRLGPLGTSATNWPIVPAPDDRWWVWSSRWNKNWQGKPKYSEETCPSASLSTTCPDRGSNPVRRGGKSATNRLSYGMAFSTIKLQNLIYHLKILR